MLWEEGVEEEEACAGDDGAVGYVEVGPVVGEDVDFNEVDDCAVEDAVVEVAEGSAEDEGEGGGCQRELVAEADEKDQDDQGGEGAEADEEPVDEVRCAGFGEEGEGCAFVGPMSDAEDAGD